MYCFRRSISHRQAIKLGGIYIKGGKKILVK